MADYITFEPIERDKTLIYVFVKDTMIPKILKHEQVFRGIVRWISVNVMNYFGRVKVSTKTFLHNKSMFKHISRFFLVRMVGGFNENVTPVFGSSTTPHMMVFPLKIFRMCSGNPGFLALVKACFSGRRMSAKRNATATIRTIFSRIFSVVMNSKWFTAYDTLFFYHCGIIA